MNIFFLDKDPAVASKYLVDNHAKGKMFLEAVQMLSTAKRLVDGYNGDKIYKLSYIKHPMTLWVCDNFHRTMTIASHLYNEKIYRFGADHKSISILNWLSKYPVQKDDRENEPPQCMPDLYKCVDYIEAYRNLYINDKIPKLGGNWTKRLKPYWI